MVTAPKRIQRKAAKGKVKAPANKWEESSHKQLDRTQPSGEQK